MPVVSVQGTSCHDHQAKLNTTITLPTCSEQHDPRRVPNGMIYIIVEQNNSALPQFFSI